MKLIKRHYHELLNWASRRCGPELLDGRGRKALDIGCAYGYGVSVLKYLGYECKGVDISRYSLRRAQTENRNEGFVMADFQGRLPFRGRIFDLVTCFEVLEHLSNPIGAIADMIDICEGVVICSTPNRIVEKPIKTIMRDWDRTHINIRTPAEWREALQKIENVNLAVESFYDANLLVSNRVLYSKSWRIPYFGLDTRILIAKKPG